MKLPIAKLREFLQERGYSEDAATTLSKSFKISTRTVLDQSKKNNDKIYPQLASIYGKARNDGHVVKVAMALDWVEKPAEMNQDTDFGNDWQMKVHEQLLDWLPDREVTGLSKLLASIGQFMEKEDTLVWLKEFVMAEFKGKEKNETTKVIGAIEAFYRKTGSLVEESGGRITWSGGQQVLQEHG